MTHAIRSARVLGTRSTCKALLLCACGSTLTIPRRSRATVRGVLVGHRRRFNIWARKQ
jgi:hypothetical protein